ncbi:integrase, catalytic region, zinc finger, CCHC-type containing protein [Tanacetum coccineum]
MDSHKLSMDTCMHAEQNERLRLRVVVQVLFSEHVKIINAIASSTVKETGESHDKATKAVPAIEQLSMYEIYIYASRLAALGLMVIFGKRSGMNLKCLSLQSKRDDCKHSAEKILTEDGLANLPAIKGLFTKINQDGDANISFPTLKELLQDVKFRQITWGKEQTIKQVMKEFDYNCDTKVIVDEFTDRLTKWLDETKSTASFLSWETICRCLIGQDQKGLKILCCDRDEDLEGDDLLLYDAEMELMNMILLSIPNEIYNSVDACTSAKDMWKRVERLMRGTIQNKVDKETRFTNKFDQFVAEPGEALVFVYNRFSQLMNDLERNNMNFPTVTINTKFLNSLQPEWLKYVTQVRLAKRLTVDSFDDLFNYLQQFEKLVNVSRAKKLEKSHDPLALVAHTDDEFHNHSEDPLASAMLLLAKAITQNFSNPTNNRLRASSNTRNQAVVQGDRV